MTDLELVEADWKKNNSEFTLAQCVIAYHRIEDNENWFKYRVGDSMLVVRRTEAHKGVFHFINAARMKDFIVNIAECSEQCKAAGFKELITYFSNPRILEVMRALPLKHFIVFEHTQYTMKVEL